MLFRSDRVELLVKEALHHGSFVAEIETVELQMVVDGTKTKTLKAAMPVPHSMWNCYPDHSTSVIGASMFYEGTMFVERYLPRYLCERMVKDAKEDGWMPSQWKKIPKDENVIRDDQRTRDVKITTYWGDINIERDDGDLYFPNHKVIMMNGTLVYMAPNKTPWPPVIYRGYERLDVRDPYYTSPIIKMSPMQKLSSMLANKYMDGVELVLEPPIVYDGNDPDFVLNDGPIIAPGSKVSSKGAVAFKEVKIGDPKVALEGLQLCLAEMKDKLGRPSKKPLNRATVEEVEKADRDEEISLINFIAKMEVALRSYLYMQHMINVQEMDAYSFYDPEADDDDFIRWTKNDLPKEVHFEVVGARGVLGERQRSTMMTSVTAFASSNPLFQPLLETQELLVQMYQDAGVKNPERFVKRANVSDPAQLVVKLQQAQQIIQKLGQALKDEKSKSQVKLTQIQSNEKTKMAKLQTDHQDRVTKMRMDFELKMRELGEKMDSQMRDLRHEMSMKAIDRMQPPGM